MLNLFIRLILPYSSNSRSLLHSSLTLPQKTHLQSFSFLYFARGTFLNQLRLVSCMRLIYFMLQCEWNWLSICVRFLARRFSLHKIEQELNTEIRPIPKSIDKGLYVAEFQQVENEEQVDATQEESRREKWPVVCIKHSQRVDVWHLFSSFHLASIRVHTTTSSTTVAVTVVSNLFSCCFQALSLSFHLVSSLCTFGWSHGVFFSSASKLMILFICRVFNRSLIAWLVSGGFVFLS